MKYIPYIIITILIAFVVYIYVHPKDTSEIDRLRLVKDSLSVLIVKDKLSQRCE